MENLISIEDFAKLDLKIGKSLAQKSERIR